MLYISTEPQERIAEETVRDLAGRPVQFLDVSDSGAEPELPAGWERLRAGDFFDPDAFRRDFLGFLEEWPTKPIWKGRSFDELFRRRGGYSVWWTGPGAERNPHVDPVRLMSNVWTCDRAICDVMPEMVCVDSPSPEFAQALRSRCQPIDLPVQVLHQRSRDGEEQFSGRVRWLTKALVRLLRPPLASLVRSQLATWSTGRRKASRQDHGNGTVVFASRFVRYFDDALRSGSSFWESACAALRRVDPDCDQRFLFRLSKRDGRYRSLYGCYHTAWPLLRRMTQALPLADTYSVPGARLRSLPRCAAMLFRYSRLERTTEFRRSFRFANADVSSVYVPRIRRAIAGLSGWEQEVAAIKKSIRSAGRVQAVVVASEMYRPGMKVIAAARELGIPTVGVQHGTIMPTNLTYTVPAAQVRGAPIPSFFAAYGEYAREVVSRHGAYPEENVWVTGSPRFDTLVQDSPDREHARRQLGLASDAKVVLITTQTYSWFPEAVRAAVEALKDRQDCVTCVKTHPKGVALKAGYYREVAREMGARNVVCFDDRFEELLAACDILISSSSTTVLEAILLGRVAVCVNFSDTPDRYPYVEDGGAIGARSPEELRKVVLAALDGGLSAGQAERRREFLRRHAGPAAECRAAETLARRLLELIGRPTVPGDARQAAADGCQWHLEEPVSNRGRPPIAHEGLGCPDKSDREPVAVLKPAQPNRHAAKAELNAS